MVIRPSSRERCATGRLQLLQSSFSPPLRRVATLCTQRFVQSCDLSVRKGDKKHITLTIHMHAETTLTFRESGHFPRTSASVCLSCPVLTSRLGCIGRRFTGLAEVGWHMDGRWTQDGRCRMQNILRGPQKGGRASASDPHSI